MNGGINKIMVILKNVILYSFTKSRGHSISSNSCIKEHLSVTESVFYQFFVFTHSISVEMDPKLMFVWKGSTVWSQIISPSCQFITYFSHNIFVLRGYENEWLMMMWLHAYIHQCQRYLTNNYCVHLCFTSFRVMMMMMKKKVQSILILQYLI